MATLSSEDRREAQNGVSSGNQTYIESLSSLLLLLILEEGKVSAIFQSLSPVKFK